VLKHLDDIESDLSAFHRIDNMWEMEAGRFFRLAYRLPAYQGAMRARAEHQEMEQQKRTGGRDVVQVGTGELSKIDGLGQAMQDGLITVEQATD
jgi:hypothetical protein